MNSDIEQICIEKNIKLTDQRKVIIDVIRNSRDHPEVEELYRRSIAIDPKISIATVYRTVKLLEESGIIQRHDFGGSRARYEKISEDHHDHIIDVISGEVIEFYNEEIEELQKKIAKSYGYEIIDHRMELYVVKLEK